MFDRSKYLGAWAKFETNPELWCGTGYVVDNFSPVFFPPKEV